MLLINYKIELKIKLRKYYVLSAVVVDNNDANSNNIIFTKFPLSLYQQKIIRNYQNFLVKDLKDQFIEKDIIQKWE